MKMLLRAPAKLAFIIFVLTFVGLIFFEVIEIESELINKGLTRMSRRVAKFKRKLGIGQNDDAASLKALEEEARKKKILAKSNYVSEDSDDRDVANDASLKMTKEIESKPKSPKIPPAANAAAAAGSNNAAPTYMGTSQDDQVCDDAAILPKPTSKKYLLALPYFDVGPNNLYRLFKETIPLAADLDRTLVVPPFHRHPRMEEYLPADSDYEKDVPKANVPIFDQNFVVAVEMNANRTIDLDCLKKKVPTVEFEEFERECKSKIHMVVECGDVDIKRRKGIKYFTGAAKLKVLKADNIANIENPQQIKALLRKLENYQCASVALGRKCIGERIDWFFKWKDFSPYVQRPKKVRDLAKLFLKDQYQSQPYLAMHWRYDPHDWNDMCKSTRPEAAKLTNAEICKFVDKMVESAKNDDNLIKQISQNIEEYMKVNNLKFAYLTGPPGLNVTFNGIKKHAKNVFTMDDVRKWSENNSEAKLQEPAHIFQTNYVASLLEQEICLRSAKFLAAPLSSWSQTVMLDRAALWGWEFDFFESELRSSSRISKLEIFENLRRTKTRNF